MSAGLARAQCLKFDVPRSFENRCFTDFFPDGVWSQSGGPPISVAAMGLGQSRIDARVAPDLPQTFDFEDDRIFGRTRVPRRAADWQIETRLRP